jgi:GNAT superfamily N-acetyltransferase
MIRVAEKRADLERCARICNAVQPDAPVTADQLVGTFLLHDDGGYAFVDRSVVPGSAYAMVRVQPDARGRGNGSSLLEASRAHARELDCDALWGRVRDEESLAFVTRRGFREVTWEITVLRELRPGDGEVAPGIVEMLDEHLRGAHAVSVECVPEIAAPQEAEERPFDEWVERSRRDCAVGFVALDGDEVVGYAQLCTTGLPHRLEHGLTAVRRTHRRRGIGSALKRAEIAWAAEHGYTELVTDMVEANAAMRGVNERLGYRPLPPTIIVEGTV